MILTIKKMISKTITIFVWCLLCVDVSQQAVEFEQQSLVTYTKCMVDAHCHKYSNNSFCYGNDQGQPGDCKCLEGYELVSRNRTFFACLGAAGYGEQCEKNVQCQLTLTENGECYEGVCRCKENSHRFTDGRCYVSVMLDDFCRSDANCWTSDGVFGNCVHGRCTCKFDRQFPTADRLGCVEGRRLSESCDDDVQCRLVANAVCRVKCECAAGYSLSRDRLRCLMTATQFGDPCEEDDQCSGLLPGSVCAQGRCACASGHHGVGGRCTRSAMLGEACASSDECAPAVEYAAVVGCSGGSCRCLPGAVNETIGCGGGGASLARGDALAFFVITFFGVVFPMMCQ